MYTTSGEIKKPYIKTRLENNNTSVLAFIMFYETIEDNPKKYFRLLSCVIYITIKNYVCIDYLACKFFKSEMTVGYIGGSKHGDKSFDRIFGIGIPYLLMNLMSCHGFLRNKNSVVILKCSKRMLEYYSQK